LRGTRELEDNRGGGGLVRCAGKGHEMATKPCSFNP
jgi:hypothetical protein